MFKDRLNSYSDQLSFAITALNPFSRTFLYLLLDLIGMLPLHYIIWNPSLELFRVGFVAVRWYSLMIILTFLGGRQLGRYIFKKEGRPVEDVDKFSLYVLCFALIGARLGEVFFYRPAYYLNHPLEALLPITLTPHFQFVGYQGLSYHGALLGGIAALYLYANCHITFSLFPFRFKFARQQRSGQNFLWLLTPLAFGVLMGFFVRIGNFINSEIVGTPTHSQHGVLFVSDLVGQLQKSSNAIESVKVLKNNAAKEDPANYQPITLEVTFKNAGFEEGAIKRFIEHKLKRYLVADHHIREHVYELPEHPLDYTLIKNRKQAYVGQIKTFGIPRHPVQLYESLSYLLTLIGLFYWWNHKRETLRDGVIAGTAMIVSYSFRFIYEFFKEPFNVLIKGTHPITMGHLLSLLTVLGGVIIIIYAYTRPQANQNKNLDQQARILIRT